MKNKLLILNICILFVSQGWSENRRSQIDSLRKILSTCYQDTNRINVMNKLSEDYMAMDIYDSAIYFAFKARGLSQQLRFSAGDAASNRIIGIGYTCQGLYSKSLEYLFQALKISESIKDNYLIGKTCNSIGVNYSFQKDYKNALNYLYKSLSFYYNPLVYEDIARVYHLQNDYMLAISFYRKALLSKIPEIEKSYIYNDLGDIYEQQNNIDSALTFYFKSLKINTELQDEVGISDAAGSIGDLFIKQKRYKDAIYYENKSLNISIRVNSKYGIVQSEKSLSDVYELIGDKNNSFYHYKRFISARDSLYNEESTKKTVQTQMQYEFDKKEGIAKAEQEKKDALSQSELKRQQAQRNALITGFILVLIFSLFIFRLLKKTQKAEAYATQQKKLVEHKSKEITDNINYARDIQLAMLPSNEYIKSNLPENFLIYRPKDIVSGDFYWSYRDGETIYISTADCTGHGVSGSMLTMIGASLLNEIVIERKITSPEKVLDMLRCEIIKSINHEGADQERKDGMDISFVKLTRLKMECASANNSIYVVRNNSVIEIKADRFPVGKHIGDEKPFTLNTMDLQKDDVIYTLSDGFCDQFSEKTGKKLMSKRFKEWILELSNLELHKVKQELENRFNSWIGKYEQVDDITVWAFRIV